MRMINYDHLLEADGDDVGIEAVAIRIIRLANQKSTLVSTNYRGILLQVKPGDDYRDVVEIFNMLSIFRDNSVGAGLSISLFTP